MEEVYYHMSPTKLELFTTLEPAGRASVSASVEGILEGCRPDSCIPRSEAVYLSESASVSRHGLSYEEGYLHIVIPIGESERRDNYWIGQLQLRHSNNQRVAQSRDRRLDNLSDEDIARKYFAGEASPNPNWEIIARRARVQAHVSEYKSAVRNSVWDKLLENQR